MVSGVLIGIMGGFMYAYQNPAGRLMGFFSNDAEVTRYRKKYSAPSLPPPTPIIFSISSRSFDSA
ncbi:hypothetical protein ACMD2_14706 [Ananas comosus]|uniref:Uncharacterized protein n=1 Tax=Ananas comosus TaxID=4615 RepID=A0A199UTI8_ANACO|nr:hypothetical protein ACMD2_14706 [Ananas comosus]